MRKSISAALAAVTFAGAVAAAAGSAEARPYNDYYRHHSRGGGSTDTAIAAGVAGLAIGALLAGSSHRSQGYYSSGSYYGGRGYYDAPRYGYGYGSPYAYGGRRYRMCESSRWVWDPYIGRRVLVRDRYPC